MLDRLKRDRKTGPPVDKLEYLDRIDVAYTIPYDWGSLAVTREADDAYGFINLEPNLVLGRLDYIPRMHPDMPTINLWLMGPTEVQGRLPEETTESTGLYQAEELSDNGVQITLSFGEDFNGMRHSIISLVEDLDKVEKESVAEQVGLLLSAGDSIGVDRAIRSSLSEALSMAYENAVKKHAGDWMWETFNHLESQAYANNRRAGLAGAAVLALTGKVAGRGGLGTAAAGAYLFNSSRNAQKKFKASLDRRQRTAETIDETSTHLSERVSHEIFLTFCPVNQDKPAELYDQESDGED